MKEETQRLSALIRIAGEEAVLKGRELAVEFTDTGYYFLVYDGKQWQHLADDKEENILRPRSLPEGLRLELATEGEQAKLGKNDEEAGSTARIYLLSSGEMTPFHITLRKENGTGGYELRGSPLGKLEMGRQANAES